MKKNFLVAPLINYYLFDYFFPLIDEILSRNQSVTLLYLTNDVKEKYSLKFGSRISYLKVPRYIQIFNNRSGDFFSRCLLWIICDLWMRSIKSKFHFALVPWDNKPIWSTICSYLPAAANDVVTNLVDIEMITKAEQFKKTHLISHKIMLCIDKFIFSKKLLPRLNGVISKYSPKVLIADTLLGKTNSNYCSGFGKSKYLTVTGHKIRSNYIALGIPPEKVIVTGHPGYDSLIAFAKKSNNLNSKTEFRNELQLPSASYTVTMFLSPSSFNENQIKELDLVFASLDKSFSNLLLIVKFHPKTKDKEANKIIILLNSFSFQNKTFIKFEGDLHNLKIMKCSDFILQKQCSLGFLALNSDTSMISYDLLDGEYFDGMYAKIGASWHAENVHELLIHFENIKKLDLKKSMLDKYIKIRHDYCINTDVSCRMVIDLFD
jgi:hypothetical protein